MSELPTGALAPGRTVPEPIARIWAELPAGGTWPGSVNVTSDFLRHFGIKRNGSLSDAERTALDRLGRKVDIAKRVCSAYDGSWEKPVDSNPLPPPFRPALVAAFIDAASRQDVSTEDGLGAALKLVNSALNALDLFGEEGLGSWLAPLTAAAVAVLDDLDPR